MTCEHMRPSLGGARLPLATFSPSCTPHHVSFRLFATLPKVPQLLKLVEDIPVELQHAAVGPGDARLPLLVADCDAVMQMYIDAGQGDKDPYWTCPWPSSLAMAEELMARPELVRGLRVADVGCGLGLGGVAAALAGAAEVVFLDREPLALQCALANAQLSGVIALESSQGSSSSPATAAAAAVQAMLSRGGALGEALASSSTRTTTKISVEVFDWSQPATLEPFDVLLGCDILYEVLSVAPLAGVAPALLGPSGRLILADPPLRAKQNRELFVQLVAEGGLVPEECQEVAGREKRSDEGEGVVVRTAPITMMILRKGWPGETVGLKL